MKSINNVYIYCNIDLQLYLSIFIYITIDSLLFDQTKYYTESNLYNNWQFLKISKTKYFIYYNSVVILYKHAY